MKVYAFTPLRDMKGGDLIGPDGNPVLLGDVCMDALRALPRQGEPPIDVVEQRKRWAIGCRFGAGGDVVLDAEEAALVQRLLARIYGPAIVGPACDLLDGQ